MNYKMIITTLTSLHLGTGQELLDLYDLKQDEPQGRTYRLNVDAILDQALSGDNPQLDQRILSLRPAELLDVAELRQHPELSFYVLRGLPRSVQVKEQLKDIHGQLYLPGSSIKGALRTVVAHSIGRAETIRPKLQVNYRRDWADPKAADDLIESVIFGRNANYDLLRALQVADTPGIAGAPILINVSVVKGNNPQAPIDLEAIPPRTIFETTLRLDDYLYKEERQTIRLENGQWGRPVDKLGWEPEQTRPLDNLAVAARNFAQRRFRQERDHLRAVGLDGPAKIYDVWLKSLAGLRGTQTFYLQLGWGGGWNNKTLGQDLIAPDDQDFAEIRTDFRLGKPPGFKGRWQAEPGDTFPLSRRLRVNSAGVPIEPLGWVEVRLEPQPERE